MKPLKTYTIGAIYMRSKVLTGTGEFMTWLMKEYDEEQIKGIFVLLDKLQAGDESIHYGRVI